MILEALGIIPLPCVSATGLLKQIIQDFEHRRSFGYQPGVCFLIRSWLNGCIFIRHKIIMNQTDAPAIPL